MAASVTENAALSTVENSNTVEIRSFSLSLNGAVVELCNIGASVTKLLLPTPQGEKVDVVLGFKDHKVMLESGNPPYFQCIVGRCANRIANGTFNLITSDKSDTGTERREYKLDQNNGKNHLHGGNYGFNRRLWDAEIVDIDENMKGVKFSLISKDGDQNYPGSVQVDATYSLTPMPAANGVGVALNIQLSGKLLDEKPTPINLAQHSYFNLSSHDDPDGILNHTLNLPSDAYTPVDETSIPTRHVQKCESDPAMDWRRPKLLSDALTEYGMTKVGLSETEAKNNVRRIARCEPNIARASSEKKEPYGFDHNYVVKKKCDGMNIAGILEHIPSRRKLTVLTDAPGVQLYTANYLDGSQDSAGYGKWQGLCLETQNYPDSILDDAEEKTCTEFAKGKCTILRPEEPDYSHTVIWKLEWDE